MEPFQAPGSGKNATRFSYTPSEASTSIVQECGPVNGLHVFEQAAPLAEDHGQAALGGVVLLVGLQVRRELLNAEGQLADLHLRAPHILPAPPVPVRLLLAGRRLPITHAAAQQKGRHYKRQSGRPE